MGTITVMTDNQKEISLEDALDDCLDRILRGQTLEECLKIYPQYAVDLKPLIETAMKILSLTDMSPRQEFKEQLRKLLGGTIEE